MQSENMNGVAGVNADTGVSASVSAGAASVKASGSASGEPAQKDKMSKKQIIGLVVLSLIAVGGVLFGVYGMNSQNEQIAELTAKVSDAEEKAAAIETEKIEIAEPEGEEIADITVNSQNPVVRSSDPDEGFLLNFNATVYGDPNANNVFMTVENGEIVACEIGKKEYAASNGGEAASYSVSKVKDCVINGVSGKIYKVVDFWAGQMKMDDNIGFILEDGTVEYVKFSDLIANSEVNVKKLNVGGPVVDAFDVGVHPTNSSVGGYVSTVFVLGNGEVVKYSEAMVE